MKLANFETTQTVAKNGTQIKGTYNFDFTGKSSTPLPFLKKNMLVNFVGFIWESIKCILMGARS